MPPRNKRKRPVKAEPPDSDIELSDSHTTPKRVKSEVKEEVKVEELSDGDFAIVLSDCELGDSSDRRPGPPVRRSAGGRPPRRGVDVSALYEEAGAGQLARSLGQVVKEEAVVASVVSDYVNVESGDESPLRVSDYVRRAAAVRAEQLLRDDCETAGETSAGGGSTERVPARRKNGRRRFKNFTEDQRAVLRAQFDVDPYPDRATKEGLSEQFGVEYKSVDNWFQDERSRRGAVNSDHDRARKRSKFGLAVYDELVAQFERSSRPDLATRKALAAKSGASVTQINTWFKHRRKSKFDPPTTVEIPPALRAELEAVFKVNPYPDRETRAKLAEKIGCSMEQIWTWFYSRRQKSGIKPRSKEDFSRQTCQFGPKGYDRLVTQFKVDPYPDTETKVALAAELGGTVKQTSKWFRNRRMSEGINEGNSARYQCSLGPAAYDELVAAFEVDPFPILETREALAAKTGGTLKQITQWFKHRRRREGIQSSGDAKARSQCKFGPQVYDELVAQFEADPFPDSATVKMFAHKAGGTSQQISSWFTHRRKRFGMQRTSEQGARLACKFGPNVYDQLVSQFEVDPHPSTADIEELADRAGATAAQIYSWFANRRQKHRTQKQK